MAKAVKEVAVKEAAEKKLIYVVVKAFHDINNFSTVYQRGENVSHFSAERLERLINAGAVEIKDNDK